MHQVSTEDKQSLQKGQNATLDIFESRIDRHHESGCAIASHVDEEDKGVTKCDILGGAQDMVIINESGLYSLVLSSKLIGSPR